MILNLCVCIYRLSLWKNNSSIIAYTHMPSEANHIDNCSYVSMQAHLVFYDMGFDSIKKAKPAKDGLVVLAVMIKVLF